MISGVNKVLKDLVGKGFSMLVVFHDIFFVEESSDKIFFMDKGKIIGSGSTSKVLFNPSEQKANQFLARSLKR